MSVLVGLFLFYHYFTKDKISSNDELLKIDGNISEYSFTHGSRGTREYYIWLDKYNCTFQIPADYLGLFNEARFKRNVMRNDKLDLYISKSRIIELTKDQKVIVYQINDDNYTYLSKIDTVYKEKKPIDIYAGIGFLLAGIIYFFIRKYIWKSIYMDA